MVLKSQSGIVELYALVNVENYSIVATGETQAEAMRAYKKLLRSNGVVDKEPTTDTQNKSVTIEVVSVRDVVVGGVTVTYIEGQDGIMYKGSIEDNESIVRIGVGDNITIFYTETDDYYIREIVEFMWLE